MWKEYHRVINLVRPRYVLVENVPALLGRGMGVVLGDLAQSGYDAEWDCIPAAAVGAPHRRDRVWLLAYPKSFKPREFIERVIKPYECRESDMAYAKSVRRDGRPTVFRREGQAGESFGAVRGESGRQGEDVAYAERERGRLRDSKREDAEDVGESPIGQESGWWLTEPNVGRVANGVPSRVDRLKGLGNAVVPAVVTWVGRRIMEAE